MVKNQLKDKHPQYFNMKVTQAVANTHTEASYSTPCANYGEEPVVMELLKVFFFDGISEFRNVLEPYVDVFVQKKTLAAAPSPDSPDVITGTRRRAVIIDTAATDATVGAIQTPEPLVIDLTDGAGNGILFANKTMILSISGANNSGVKSAQCKILYRLKRVAATELLGILSE